MYVHIYIYIYIHIYIHIHIIVIIIVITMTVSGNLRNSLQIFHNNCVEQCQNPGSRNSLPSHLLEGAMIRLETLIELKFLHSSFSSLSSYGN